MSERDRKNTHPEMGHIGDLSVLDSLKAKAADTSRDDIRPALILMGGGQKTIVTAGVALALENKQLNAAFDYSFGTSVGAVGAYYFAANQSLEGANIIRRQAQERNFYRLGRFMHIMNKPALKHTLEVQNPVLSKTLQESRTEIECGLTDMDGNPVIVDLKKVPKPADYLIASMSHPLVTGGKPAEVNGEKYVDGCIGSPLPLDYVTERAQATDILIVLTRSPINPQITLNFWVSLLEKAASRNYSPQMKRQVSSYEERLNEEFVRLQTAPPEGVARPRVLTIYPENLAIGLATTDREKLNAAIARSFIYMNDLLG